MLTHTHAAVISDADIASFRERGFVKLRHLLNPREIAVLHRAMQEALETLAESPSGYDVTAAADAFWSDAPPREGASVQHDLAALAQAVRQSGCGRLVDGAPWGQRGHFLLDTSVWRRVPCLAKLALMSAVPKVAHALLGYRPIRYYDDQLFVKEPGAIDRTAFHQDFPYFHLDRADGCVFWIPLAPVREGGGRMGYVPGSHRWGRCFKPNIFVSTLPFPGSEGADMPAIEQDPERYGVEYLDAEPGDVIVHHFLTVHGSEGNRGSRTRAAFSLRYCDADVRFRHRRGAPPQPLHRSGAKDGDPLDDTIHPVLRAVPGELLPARRMAVTRAAATGAVRH